MVSVEDAEAIILSHLFKPVAEPVRLSEAVDRVLAEKIAADRDFPPFHRVAMDGIAIQYAAWEGGQRDFVIAGVQAAGMEQQKLNDYEQCLEVMTGAMLPEGADTVIRYEDITSQGNTATITQETVEKGQNVHRQASDAKEGALLLEPGLVLSPAEIALLASVGKSTVAVYTFPQAAIISTGDELVEVDESPEPHQIRRSNAQAIQAAMAQMRWRGQPFHVPDQKDAIRASLEMIAGSHDVLILSGGVSKGKFDFIPEVLESLGVKKLFHQVSQRPGKPFWFGVTAKGKVVFALPGNPVSTYMCFYRFVKPWLQKSLGIQKHVTKAILAKDFSFTPKLTFFLQVHVANEEGKLMAYPDAGGGSGDFANLKKVDGFLELPIGRDTFKAGEVFLYWPFRAVV